MGIENTLGLSFISLRRVTINIIHHLQFGIDIDKLLAFIELSPEFIGLPVLTWKLLR